MKTRLDGLEEALLKLFRVAMLTFMILALVVVVVAASVGVHQLTQTAKAADPIKAAPQRQLTVEDLKAALRDQIKADEEEQRQKKKGETSSTSTGSVPPSLRYLEDTTTLYRCSQEFARKVGAEIEDEGNSAANQRLESLRARIEELAANSTRGDAWVKSAIGFTCQILSDAEIIGWVKDQKLKGVVFTTLNLHIRLWDKLVNDRTEYEAAEKRRYEAEEAAEQARVAVARALGVSLLTASGIAFGVFMILAFYLLFSKIERNLRPLII
jgi:hypothetical protein